MSNIKEKIEALKTEFSQEHVLMKKQQFLDILAIVEQLADDQDRQRNRLNELNGAVGRLGKLE